MSIDNQLRELLDSRAQSQTITVSGLDAITDAGDRSCRLGRASATLCAVSLVLLSVFSFAAIRGAEKPTAMFAGLSHEQVAAAPTQIVRTDTGWLGVMLVFQGDQDESFLRESTSEVYIATSEDGQDWEPAWRTGLTTTTPEFAVDHYDGRYWMALADDGELYVAYSDDLESWKRIDLPPDATDFSGEFGEFMTRTTTPKQLVAADAGVMILSEARTVPDFESLIGVDMDGVCGTRWSADGFGTAARVGVRMCGSATWDEAILDDEIQVSIGGLQSRLLFSSDGASFETVDTGDKTITLPYSRSQNLYPTADGFGLADYALLESDDGENWVTFDGHRWSSPSFAAVRDGVRVAISSSQQGPIQVQRSSDGIEWTSHSLHGALDLGPPADAPIEQQKSFSVRSLRSGVAGWVLTGYLFDIGGSRPGSQIDPERVPAVVELDDGHEIRGTLNGGPANLFSPDGDIVRSWEGFEFGRPSGDGVEFDEERIVFMDERNRIVDGLAFPEWMEEVSEQSMTPQLFVLFSSDGSSWTTLYQGLNHVASTAVADEEVFVVMSTNTGLEVQNFDVSSE